MTRSPVSERSRPSTQTVWVAFVVWCIAMGVAVAIVAAALGTVPKALIFALGAANLIVVASLAILLRRATAEQARTETSDEKTKRLLRAKSGLRKGAVLYGLILLWDVYLASRGRDSVVTVVVALFFNLFILLGLIFMARRVNREIAKQNPPANPM